MNKRVIFIVLLIVVLIAGAGGFWMYQQQQAKARTAAQSRQTTTISQGNLVASVAGAGNLYAPQQTNLNFELTGVPIVKINVQVGDKVKSGQLLAQADDTDLQFQVRTAQASLASAQANMDKLKLPPLPSDVAAAQAQLASADAAYKAAVNTNSHASDQIVVAKAALDKANVALQQAQATYDKISWRSDVGTTTEAANLQSATIDYQSALASYTLAATNINDTGIKSAAQNLASAQANLVKVTQPPTPQDLAVSQAGIDSAQVNLDQAQSKLDQAKIIAPFDGTVAAVNYVIGQLTPSGSSNPVIALVNLDTLQTQITLSEVDLPKVKMGDAVQLTFDALGSRQFQGKIVSISPVGTITQGVVNYTVTVALVKSESTVMPGMTAEATIITAEHDNVLMVPNRAVRGQGNQHSMTILYEGQEIPVAVQTGLSNDTNTEIAAAATFEGQTINLQAGDVVVLNPTTTTSSANRGGGGINPLGGLGGFGTGR